ncbi:pilin [Idiomarina aminovorans]|uniref:pilin n=1 Tax=Idiomarina aminovorans TaxID=2914829 RepID=UPI002003E0BF|nr:prepilin-type N-terminal cleavage/methylation domain-containing protein [Idiomarina sp. ATCH4]MCK7459044.1 prepilin-type N-terminal cleavage/methylation domain-containing protein [Idiomarina sp. ATCH4]
MQEAHFYRVRVIRFPGNGFSLIEMMVVVAIIAILSAIAVPSYTYYTQQAKVSKALAHAQPLQLGIALCWQIEGQLTQCNQAGNNGIPSVPSPLPDELSDLSLTQAAAVRLTLNSVNINNQPLQIELTPNTATTHLAWNIACSDFGEARSVVQNCEQQVNY